MTKKVQKEPPPMDLKTLERELTEVVRKTKTLAEFLDSTASKEILAIINQEELVALFVPISAAKILQLFAVYYGLDPASVKVEQ